MIKHKIVEMKISELRPAPYNPRSITDDAMKGLEASMGRFGIVEPVIFNKRSGFVVGGHQRLKVLKKAGEKVTDVVVVDLADEEEKALNLTLNSPHITGDYNEDLQPLLEKLKGNEPLWKEFEAFQLHKLFQEINLEPIAFEPENKLDQKSPVTCPSCGHEFIP